MVRKERKTYGLQQLIEGELTDRPIVLVDDMMNSGESLEKARVVLDRAGKKISEIFVVVDFQSKKGMIWRKLHDIKINSLFTLEDFNLAVTPPKPVPQQRFEFVWRYAAEPLAPFDVVPKSTPVIVGNSICFGTDAAAFVSLDMDTGKENWSYQAKGAMRKGIWSSAALAKGRLYFGAYNGIVYCLRLGRLIPSGRGAARGFGRGHRIRKAEDARFHGRLVAGDGRKAVGIPHAGLPAWLGILLAG